MKLRLYWGSVMAQTAANFITFTDFLADSSGRPGPSVLLTTGDVITVPTESELNSYLATVLQMALIKFVPLRLVKTHTVTLEIEPTGDNWRNRYPDLLVLRPEHIDLMAETKQAAIQLGMPAPQFVAEVVSPGPETSDNYRRDYDWKRHQYEQWEIPEYWIIDPVRAKVTVLLLEQGHYREEIYQDEQWIESSVFPKLRLQANSILIA